MDHPHSQNEVSGARVRLKGDMCAPIEINVIQIAQVLKDFIVDDILVHKVSSAVPVVLNFIFR